MAFSLLSQGVCSHPHIPPKPLPKSIYLVKVLVSRVGFSCDCGPVTSLLGTINYAELARTPGTGGERESWH